MADSAGSIATEAQAKSTGWHDRIPELDGLRGIAIALVMAQHALTRPYKRLWTGLFGEPFAKLIDMAWCGVDVFFVLSGFLIGGIILAHRDSERFYPAFYARRTTRIFPAYFLLVALAWIPLGAYGHHRGAVPLVAYATFTSNFYTAAGVRFSGWLRPLWSVNIEEQFYLLAPFALRFLSLRAIPWVLASVLAGSVGLRLTMLLDVSLFGVSPWDFTLTRLDGLALGVLAAFLMRDPAFVRFARERLRTLGVVLALLLLGCAWASQGKMWIVVGLGVLAVSAATFVAVIIVRLHADSWFGRVLRLRYLVFLGRYSYFLYLFNMPALWLAAISLPDDLLVLPAINRMAVDVLAMIALCAIAPLSWRYFEAPLLALGRRVGYGPRPASTEPAFGPQPAAIKTP
jgi:peptidoglycan/LPS O-acetylase OafA/YrhL